MRDEFILGLIAAGMNSSGIAIFVKRAKIDWDEFIEGGPNALMNSPRAIFVFFCQNMTKNAATNIRSNMIGIKT